MKLRKISWITVACLCAGIIGYFSCHYYGNFKEQQRKKTLFEQRKTAWRELRQTIEDEISRFKGETGIVIRDLQTNWEISFNKDRLFPSASLVKIPIMMSCFSAAQEDKLKFENTLELKSTDKVSGSGILKDMRVGKAISIEDLLGLMVSDSDNTATNMLIEQLGFEYLNSFFKTLGLKNTNLSRKIVDFQSRSQGAENYTTAEDMVFLLEKIYRRDFINRAVSEKCIRLLKQQRINDRIPAYLPVELSIAHKTGLERTVCHDVGIVYTSKGNFLVCVLTKHSETTSKLAKEFIATIASCVYSYYQQF